MRRVLVTRPEPGAARTALRLAELGFEPVVLPLSEIRPLPVDADMVPAGAGVVALTSANAARHAPPELIARLAGLPCHAVGSATAHAARAAGFRQVLEGHGDALSLAERIAASFSGTLVYLCGRVRFPAFEARLAAAGVRVHAVESYDTAGVAYADEEVSARLAGRPVDAVLLASAKAADAIARLAARPQIGHLFAGASFFALSGRIATALAEAGGGIAEAAAVPTERALLGLLEARRPAASSHRPFSPP